MKRYDPLKCPRYGTTVLFQELYFNHHRVPLDELYEKVIAIAKHCRSPVFFIIHSQFPPPVINLLLIRRIIHMNQHTEELRKNTYRIRLKA